MNSDPSMALAMAFVGFLHHCYEPVMAGPKAPTEWNERAREAGGIAKRMRNTDASHHETDNRQANFLQRVQPREKSRPFASVTLVCRGKS
jgi:hypothetical protein